MNIINTITTGEVYFLIASGLIAFCALPTKYRYVGIILFVEFLVMTGYQTFVLEAEHELFPTVQHNAWFYSIKFLLQSVFLLTYLELKCRALGAMSAIIMGYLFYVMVLALLGIEAENYEFMMTGLSVVQLIIGLIGVISGHWNNPNFIRRYFNFSGHKRA